MYRRGTVVVASDPFGNAPRRPYLIVSDGSHPFAGAQYIGAGISTKEYDASVPLAGAFVEGGLDRESFVEGGLDRESFVAPWAVVSLREATVDRAVARVEDDVTETTVRRLVQFVGYSGG
ncbi:hypothetical protein [Halorubrum distributum]|uniref:PemK-like protein n=1 Tax=Halorubrum distributum JCM 10247 TaxID=1227486 RepID=M0D8S8_9EURY|nr:hypothetical protein [Halorubrum terrestre]ELZ31905.1 hypothetical protein C473_10383 [Halorubrum terrestre JCM 10247]